VESSTPLSPRSALNEKERLEAKREEAKRIIAEKDRIAKEKAEREAKAKAEKLAAEMAEKAAQKEAGCQDFVAQTFKKNFCANCFQAKDDHFNIKAQEENARAEK
jgi:hypothetical protein